MWLSTISKRTPKAYFFYFVTSLALLIIPLGSQYFQGLGTGNAGLQAASWLIPVGLIMVLSVLCNRIYVISDLLQRNTLWPGHFYLLIALAGVLDADWQTLVVHGMAGILIINEMLSVHYNRDARLQAFNIAFCIGIASFFESTTVFLAVFLLLGLRVLKPLNLKEYLVYALGVTTPYYFLWSYSFLSGDYSHWSVILQVGTWFSLPETWDWFLLVRWGLTLLPLFIALALVSTIYNSLSVRLRRLTMATLYLLAGCFVMALSGGGAFTAMFYMAPCFAYLVTILMLRYSNNPRMEVIHIIFVGIIISTLLVGHS